MKAAASQRLKLLIAYDGRAFSGWQSQAGKNGVQDHLEAVLQKFLGYRVVVHGSGRTDAGVHALGQVAHAEVPRGRLTAAKWRDLFNGHLVREVRIMRCALVRGGRDGFHARFDVQGKRYTYRIWNDRWMHPLEIGRAWHDPLPLDLATLRAAASLLVGTHDFAGFAANRGTPVKDTTRTIHRIAIQRRSPLITLHFEGDGFLYHMVRLLTGTLARVAHGRASLDSIRDLLARRGPEKTHYLAPAEGLYLAKVFYR